MSILDPAMNASQRRRKTFHSSWLTPTSIFGRSNLGPRPRAAFVAPKLAAAECAIELLFRRAQAAFSGMSSVSNSQPGNVQRRIMAFDLLVFALVIEKVSSHFISLL